MGMPYVYVVSTYMLWFWKQMSPHILPLDPYKYFPSTQSSFCVIGIDPCSSLVSLCSPQKNQKEVSIS